MLIISLEEKFQSHLCVCEGQLFLYSAWYGKPPVEFICLISQAPEDQRMLLALEYWNQVSAVFTDSLNPCLELMRSE